MTALDLFPSGPLRRPYGQAASDARTPNGVSRATVIFYAPITDLWMTRTPRAWIPKDVRRAQKTTEIVEFVSAVGRKASKRNGMDPNDRHFDPDFSKRLRRMPPQEFSRLLQEDED